jgi:transposase
MSKGESDKITYKPYEQNQPYLIPPNVDDLIPEDHLVRLVSKVIDEMKVEQLLAEYQTGGGASQYHPAMMLKLFVYGYLMKACSSRMLAKAVRENIMFMWLAGGQKPDFRTLNNFRLELPEGALEDIFIMAVNSLSASGYIKPENYFAAGTRIESASGWYIFTPKKAVKGNAGKTEEKLRAYFRMAQDAWDGENSEYEERDLEELGGKSKGKYADMDYNELVDKLSRRLLKPKP